MNSKKIFYILSGLLIALGVGVFACAYGANAVLQKQSDTLVGLKASNLATENERAQLVKNKADIAKWRGMGRWTSGSAFVPERRRVRDFGRR